jgi:uncharacterized membrane protein (DUF2068 family)
MHHDLPESLARLARHLRFNPESKFVDFLMDRASLMNDKLLRRIGFSLFAYATVGTIEGIGLYLEKAWAEYLTLLITASFLPFEIFEVYRRVNLMRSSLLIINVLVFAYLLKVLIDRGRQKRLLNSKSR